MNLRRGLIRLWVFCSVIWIAGVVIAGVYDPKLHPADPDPWAAYTGGSQATEQEFEQKADIGTTLSKYARIAFGPPIILLMFGVGIGWVAIGFKSDVAPGLPDPEPQSDPNATARNRRR